GEIRLPSAPGKGSTSPLFLPQTYSPPRAPARKPAGEPAPAPAPVPPPPAPDAGPVPEPEPPVLVNEAGDDRDSVRPGDKVLLIVENDLQFARFMLEVARERGFKGLVTSLGAAALAMTREYKPAAITLDICLPDIEGWRVLERLKTDVTTRPIPVFVISREEAHERSRALGAMGFLAKPIKTKESLQGALETLWSFINRARKDLLVVAADPARREHLLEIIGN